MTKKISNHKNEFSSYHVGVAAEAIAAGQFARLGYNVSVQYGANQPEYDLVISIEDMLVKVSVKGSNDGGWGLTQGFLKEANLQNPKLTPNHHGAIKMWLDKHGSKTIFCFVQFLDKKISEMPTIYLASPKEVAEQLRKARKGIGDTVLRNHTWPKNSVGYGTSEKIPDNWIFSEKRMKELIK